MAATGFLGVRTPPRRDPMSQMDAEDLIEFLLKSNQEMVDAAREWEESAVQDQQKAEVEIAGLRARCAEYEAIIAENERGLQQELAKSSRNVQHLTEALREEASMSSDEIEHLRLELEKLRTERNTALSRAKAAENASTASAREVSALREQLAAAQSAKGVSLEDAREMQEELDTARKERSAMEKQLETLKKHHERTAEYKRQTMVYLKRYENQIAGLERERKELVKENNELRQAGQDAESRDLSAGQVEAEQAADYRAAKADAQAAKIASVAAAEVRVKSLSAKFTPPSTPTNTDAASEPLGQVFRGAESATVDAMGPRASVATDQEADRAISAARRPAVSESETFSTPSHGLDENESESESDSGSPERKTAATPSLVGGRAAVESTSHRTGTGFSDASSIMSMESTGAVSSNASVSDGSNW